MFHRRLVINSHILFIYAVWSPPRNNPRPCFFTSPVSISRSVCWQVTLSCLRSVEIDVGTLSWHAVHLFDTGGIWQDFPIWAMRALLFSPVQPLSSTLQGIFRHIQVTVCVLPPYHRYTREYTDMLLWYEYWPRWFVFACLGACTHSHTCKKTIIWFGYHVNRRGVWGRIVKMWYFYRMFVFLYPILILIYNIVKEVIPQLLRRRLKGCEKAKTREFSLISLSKPWETIKSIGRDEHNAISSLQ